MARPVIRVMPNGHVSTYGAVWSPPWATVMMGRTDTLPIRIELDRWMEEGDSLSAHTLTVDGATASAARSGTHVDLTVTSHTGCGELTLQVTTTNGWIRTFKIRVEDNEEVQPDGYEAA